MFSSVHMDCQAPRSLLFWVHSMLVFFHFVALIFFKAIMIKVYLFVQDSAIMNFDEVDRHLDKGVRGSWLDGGPQYRIDQSKCQTWKHVDSGWERLSAAMMQ